MKRLEEARVRAVEGAQKVGGCKKERNHAAAKGGKMKRKRGC